MTTPSNRTELECFVSKDQQWGKNVHSHHTSSTPPPHPGLWWGKTDKQKLYISKVYNVVIWYMYTLWNDYHNQAN